MHHGEPDSLPTLDYAGSSPPFVSPCCYRTRQEIVPKVDALSGCGDEVVCPL